MAKKAEEEHDLLLECIMCLGYIKMLDYFTVSQKAVIGPGNKRM